MERCEQGTIIIYSILALQSSYAVRFETLLLFVCLSFSFQFFEESIKVCY